MLTTTVCRKPLEDFIKDIERFHGWAAPGVVIGGFMVDWAQELLGHEVEADAIVETRYCLCDAVQLLTPCTCGNGWLKILDWDKFALSLYNKKNLNGYRVWLDIEKILKFPNLYNWFMRRVAKKDLPLEVLNQTILEAGRAALSAAPVHIIKHYAKIKKGETGVCSICGEAYTLRQGTICLSCQGEDYFEFEPPLVFQPMMVSDNNR